MDILPLSSSPVPISASSLIAALHQTFSNSQDRSLGLDSSSTLVFGAAVDEELVTSIWEHAYKRSEFQALLILPTHPASSSSFFSAVSSFPNINLAVLQCLNVIFPFFTALTPQNLSARFHNGIRVALSLNAAGDIVSSRISVSQSPYSSLNQLLKLQNSSENRSFDVFYHLLLAESDRSQYLSLKSSPDQYDLLAKSGTYTLPDWVMYSDDYALAKDWSNALRQCGLKGSALRGVLSTLSGILLLGNSDPNDIAEGASLIGIDPSIQNEYNVEELIASSMVSLVHSVVAELNKYLAQFDAPTFDNQISTDGHQVEADSNGEDPNEVVAVVSIVECNDHHKTTILRNVFDNSAGISAELIEDGIPISKTPASVAKELVKLSSQTTQQPPPLIPNFRAILDSSFSYLSFLPRHPNENETDSHLDIASLAEVDRLWTILNLSSCQDAASQGSDVWSSSVVSSQVREYFITEWAEKRKGIDFTADFDLYEFLERYSGILPPDISLFNLEEWARNEKGWTTADFYMGSHRIWLSEPVWKDLELGLENLEAAADPTQMNIYDPTRQMSPQAAVQAALQPFYNDSRQNSFMGDPHNNVYAVGEPEPMKSYEKPLLSSYDESSGSTVMPKSEGGHHGFAEYTEEGINDEHVLDEEDPEYYIKAYQKDLENEVGGGGRSVEVVEVSPERKAWVWFVWLLTFWIPSPFLKFILGMRRQEVRMAWREKLVICFLILLFNGGIIFYMIFLGKFVCTDYDKVWSAEEVATHQGTKDYYVAIHGKVYDMTKFYKTQHSDNGIETTSEVMMQFAGQDLSGYFPPPLTVACSDLVSDKSVLLRVNETQYPYTEAIHYSGSYKVPQNTTALHKYSWYNKVLEPSLKKYYKGRMVSSKKYIEQQGDNGQYWFTLKNEVFDVTPYFYTIQVYDESLSDLYKPYNFFDSKVVEMFSSNQGGDLTDDFYGDELDDTTRAHTLSCLRNAFAAGEVDFRDSARCQAANVILLVMAGILTSVTVVKFLASLRFGSSKVPSPQDKFVISQIPVYTESEEELRLAIDSLTTLKYDNRRKLMVIICDGMITGSGNDRPTPRIVLDLLGVDEKVDPPELPYLSIAEGANRLNYAKVYSGLYECEGNVVPYLVVVKVGRPQEQNRPGNRGKRDSQIILLNFLNHVHYQAPMTPLELEMFHQLNNVIGVDPELYEYLFMVDADTSVHGDALTRLVASCVYDGRIAGICGETALQNEDQSWTTMIQVYEYFISHHLTKAFESLFGSVTCLPGCFSMYRLRTAKTHKPLIISSGVISEYAVTRVDTLHKKNLFSLGEDRYLTTLMSKHFPKMKYTFVADALAETRVPEDLGVLLSQRRRWINSTVHNLVELLRLRNMCGFCCFGMRGIVLIDLIGTIMLPSVVVYLGYLIYRIASHSGPLPLISIILIAAVYGLQALVFVFRRQWQHIGWMIIYVFAYPIHSFLLPIYSFWNMDNFSWGNTRIVVGEKGGKQVVAVDDEGFDPNSVQLETWSSYAMRNGLPGAERQIIFDDRKGKLYNNIDSGYGGYDMQDMNTPQFQSGASRAFSLYSKGDDYKSARPFSTYSVEFGRVSSPNSHMMGGGISRSQTLTTQVIPAGQEILANDSKDDIIRETIRRLLQNSDLDNMTKRQLREKIQDAMGVCFSLEKANDVDRIIDEELEVLEDADGI